MSDVLAWLRRMMATEKVVNPPPDPEPDTTLAEQYEAECRKRMAEIATLKVRGWDSQRERARLIRLLDTALDAYNRCSDGRTTTPHT